MLDMEPRTKLPAAPAALIGVLSVAIALAAGHLLAGFVGTPASPYLAVGSAAIDLSPGWLKEFAISSFGANDKTVLLSGMAMVLLLIGIVAGLISRRRAAPGTVLAALLGVLGFVAVFSRPGLGELAALAPAASMLGGVLTFPFLHGLARSRFAPDAGNAARDTPAAATSRRNFMVGSAGVAVGAGIAGLAGQLLVASRDLTSSEASIGKLVPVQPAPPIPRGADFVAQGTPSFITPARYFYRVDTALTVPHIQTRDWQLRVHGMVEREHTYSFSDIRNRPLKSQVITMTCVSNPVGGPYISTAEFIGIPMKDLLLPCGVHESADQLFATSSDGFTAGSPLHDVLDRGMLAIGMNGQPLPVEHGFPARIVVPGLYGYVSATKWVTDLELTTFDAQAGYWIPRGWSQRGPIKTESRIDAPHPFATMPSGKVTVAGIAWAQPTGVAKVEVQVDSGPWRAAQLATEVSPITWRMWRITLDLAAGKHTVRCRATDASGHTQTTVTAPPAPNGASGLPSVTVTTT